MAFPSWILLQICMENVTAACAKLRKVIDFEMNMEGHTIMSRVYNLYSSHTSTPHTRVITR